MRLQGGMRTSEGRVEVCRRELWQTVCDMNWDNTEASVVCKELGFSIMSKYTQWHVNRLACSLIYNELSFK